uniref:HAT C-terminal dimerisation domain-containing protein n=1 Tax=Trichuris muris TaxID=70415 RepID=A0A5S6Q6W4_TRIMR
MDIAYLADLYFKFNEMNKQLQSHELNLIKTKAVITAFISKLMLFKCHFARGEFCQFPMLAKVSNVVKILEDDVNIYCQHLQMLYEDFLRRFDDLLSLVLPSWLLDPFIVNSCNVDIYLQEELIDLQSNEEIKARMKRSYEYFWLHEKIPAPYPALWAAMKRLLIAIASSSVVERGFSVVTDLVTKKRNRLEVVNRGDLRLRVTSMRPNVERIDGLHAACLSE